MHCAHCQELLVEGPDSAASAGRQTELQTHLASCALCRRLQQRLAETYAQWRVETGAAPSPDSAEEWRLLRANLHRSPAPIAAPPRRWASWVSLPLAAAAAVALLVWIQHGAAHTSRAAAATPLLPRAEFVETGDARASTLVYVDEQSGWLVVWSSAPAGGSG